MSCLRIILLSVFACLISSFSYCPCSLMDVANAQWRWENTTASIHVGSLQSVFNIWSYNYIYIIFTSNWKSMCCHLISQIVPPMPSLLLDKSIHALMLCWNICKPCKPYLFSHQNISICQQWLCHLTLFLVKYDLIYRLRKMSIIWFERNLVCIGWFKPHWKKLLLFNMLSSYAWILNLTKAGFNFCSTSVTNAFACCLSSSLLNSLWIF